MKTEQVKLQFFAIGNCQNARAPKRAHKTDSGMDIRANERVRIRPHSWEIIHTGIGAVIPHGYELQLRPRSGLQCKHGIVAAFGTIDEGYRGEICVALYNHGYLPYVVSIGDRIAQLVLAPIVRPEIEIIDKPPTEETDRKANGFGSTGR